MYYANTNYKEAGPNMLILDTADSITRNITRTEKGLFLMIKVLILQEEVTILNIIELQNMCSKPDRTERKFLRNPQGELKSWMFFILINRERRQKICKDVESLNNTIS